MNNPPVIHAPKIPPGFVFQFGQMNSMSINLGDPETRALIKACHHVIQLMEGTAPECEPPEIKEIHPGIKAYISDLGKSHK